MAVLEVLKPAPTHRVDSVDDRLQAEAVRALGMATDRVLVLLQALLARPTIAALEVVPKEVEAARLGGVHDARLVGMKLQTGSCRPRLHLRQGLLGLLSATTQDDEVVGIPHHLVTLIGHSVVERVQVDVGQQGTDYCSLWSSLLRSPVLQTGHHFLFEKGTHQVQDPAVRHLRLNPRQQTLARDRVVVAAEVGVHHVGIASFQQRRDAPQSILGTSPRTESVAVSCKVPFEDRFQNVPQRTLHHPVSNRRNPQRALLRAPRLGNPYPANRLRTVATVFQARRQDLQVPFQLVRKLRDRHMVNASAPPVPLAPLVGRPQVPSVIDLVDQTEPLTSFDPSFEGRQHAIRPDTRFHPGPTAPSFSGLFSPYRHCRTVVFQLSVRHAIHLPVPLCSTPITALLSSYGDSDSSVSLLPDRGLPASRHTSFETILPPITQRPPSSLSHATPQLDGSPLMGSRLHL